MCLALSSAPSLRSGRYRSSQYEVITRGVAWHRGKDEEIVLPISANLGPITPPRAGVSPARMDVGIELSGRIEAINVAVTGGKRFSNSAPTVADFFRAFPGPGPGFRLGS